MSVASTATTLQHDVQMRSISTLSMKPVRGIEERWESMKAAINKHVVPLYGAQSKLLGKVEKDKNYKCRLLYDGNVPVGVLIYKEKLSQKDAGSGFSHCLRIKMFNVWETRQTQNYADFLLNYALEAVKNLKARALSIKLARNDRNLTTYMQNKEFHYVRNTSNNILSLYARVIPEVSLKRSREENTKTDPSKKQKISFDNMTNSSSQRTPFITIRRTLPPAVQNVAPLPSQSLGNQQKERRLTSTTIMLKYLRMIGDERKTIEGRINSGMFANVRAGEKMQFFCGEEKVLCDVTKINHYRSFREMLEQEGFKRCLPDVGSLESAVWEYEKIKGYSERARQSGVVAIHLKKIH